MRSPTTTPVPDEIFDYWLTRLGEAELKVLLYIVRRTLGFYKRTDAISISQLCEGIQDRDGGTGLARSSVKEALLELKKNGLIEATRQDSESAGHLPTLYTIVWDPIPLAGKTTKPLATPAKPPLAAQPDIQETEETPLQETVPPYPPQAGGDEDIILWIQQQCAQRNIRPGFRSGSPAAKRVLRDGDSPALRVQILQILDPVAGMQRNMAAPIQSLVNWKSQSHRSSVPAPPRRRVHEPFPPPEPRPQRPPRYRSAAEEDARCERVAAEVREKLAQLGRKHI